MEQNIWEYISKNKSVTNFPGLKKVNDKWDLRNIQIGDKESIQRKFIGVEIKDVDFSKSNLSGSLWKNCRFDNVLFEKTKAENVEFRGCSFYNVKFINSNLRGSLIGGRQDSNCGKFDNVEFVKCNMLDTHYTCPEFKKCKFINCKLNEVSFTSSKFYDCKFVGKLDSVMFNGVDKYLGAKYKEFNLTYEDIFNPMDNVDFTEAELCGIGFYYYIDISKCKFPTSDEYIFIKNFPEVYQMALRIIETDWIGENKSKAINILNVRMNNFQHEGNKNDLIDKKMYYEVYKDKTLIDNIFDILRRTNNEYI